MSVPNLMVQKNTFVCWIVGFAEDSTAFRITIGERSRNIMEAFDKMLEDIGMPDRLFFDM